MPSARASRRLPASLLAAGFVVLGIAWGGGARAQGTLSALETDMERVFRLSRPSVVTVVAHTGPGRARRSLRSATRVGSGVAVSENEILTTVSVVQHATRLWIRTSNNLQVDARLVGLDPISNVALLRVSGVRLPPLPFYTSRKPQEGDWVMAIGTARDNVERITQSAGSIAYRHRDPRLALTGLTNHVYPGFSGGAVVNSRAELIGIVQGELDEASQLGLAPGQRPASGISFMLPTESARAVYAALQREGRVRYGYLGVGTRAASVESESEAGVQIPIGAQVENVVPGSPASRLLRSGDLIVAFEGVRVEHPAQLARWVAASPPGSSALLVWVRDELQVQGRVVLTESPTARPEWAETPPLASRSGGGGGPRVAELEQRIQRLNRELTRLKNTSPADSR